MDGGWDAGQVYAVPQRLQAPGAFVEATPELLQRAEVAEQTLRFVRDFRVGTLHVYREKLLNNAQEKRYHLEIDLEHLKNFSEELHDAITRMPAVYLPHMENGARSFLIKSRVLAVTEEEIPLVQITFIGQLRLTPIRDITAAEVNRMLLVPGIVITAARTRPKATILFLQCKSCRHERSLPCPPSGTQLPFTCSNNKPGEDNGGNPPPRGGGQQQCQPNPYVIIPDKCTFVDVQELKLQEAPETVPTGEMPRTVNVAVDRVYANLIAPGTRVRFLAIASLSAAARGAAVAVRVPCLRAVGVLSDEDGGGRSAITTFTPEEEARLKAIAADPDVLSRLAANVAPSIAGDYTDDIKKAIIYMLLGGRWKKLPDGGRLRGDINVLMLGDPSTAKSQFLKFVEKVAPVAVYTSGKGSSAAGLTASVIKDQRGEFHLSAGAMVLADGGVVCIDEFDKMRDEDRVAIHEAMEQQTISIAKAGITTILNSRCSVLAAANPTQGRYDDSMSIADNIKLEATILSRFDLMFIVRDTRDTERDREIARHVVKVHVTAQDAGDEGGGGGAGDKKPRLGGREYRDIDLHTMKKYIAYARAKCAPVITAEAAELLAGEYADIRQQAEGAALAAQKANAGREGTNVGSKVPITVRQLEALVRVTEAVAKASLSRDAGPEHAKEALALFKKSTLAAAQKGNGVGDVLSPDLMARVKACEQRILKVVGPGQTLPVSHVKSQLRANGFDEAAINAALRVMDSREEIRLVDERKMVRRLR